jgi:hypothetical protein
MSDPEELIKLFTDQPALSESDINLCVMIMRDRDLAEAIGLSDGDLYLLGHGGEKWRPCPAHQGDADNMSVRMSDTGRLLFHCYSHGCSSQEIVSALRADAGRR